MREQAGINCPPRHKTGLHGVAAAVTTLHGPVAVKAIIDGLLHKTEAGAVALNLSSARDALASAEAMVARLAAPDAAFLVEEMVSGAVAEVVLGTVQDAQAGLFLTIGSGGILAELVADRVMVPIRCGRDEIRAAIRTLRVASVLDGYRCGPEGDMEALVEMAFKVCDP